MGYLLNLIKKNIKDIIFSSITTLLITVIFLTVKHSDPIIYNLFWICPIVFFILISLTATVKVADRVLEYYQGMKESNDHISRLFDDWTRLASDRHDLIVLQSKNIKNLADNADLTTKVLSINVKYLAQLLDNDPELARQYSAELLEAGIRDHNFTSTQEEPDPQTKH